MKVYGITLAPPSEWAIPGREARVIVAAKSRKAAAEAIRTAGATDLTEGFLATYGSETWSELELDIALADPGVVFAAEEKEPVFRAVSPAAAP